jgi:hypothetical protein
MDYGDMIERTKTLGELLSAYADMNNQPTELELWVGCKDGGAALESAADAIEALVRENEKLRARIEKVETLMREGWR